MPLSPRATLPVLMAATLVAGPALALPQASTFTLENGLQGIVIEDHRAPVVTHMVWYPVGAADEPPGKSGIAHYLEHLMFKGTDEIPEGAFSKIVADNGGSDNAFTAQDYTGYFQRIAADRLGIVMGMEADRMRDLAFSEETALTERDVILEERSQRTDNNPQSLFYEQVTAALFQNHPYGIPVIGWRHEMEGLTREDAFDFYRRHYAPDNAFLVVAGAVTPEEVERLAVEHYGALEPAGLSPDPRPSEPPQLAERRVTMSDPRVRQPYVLRQYLVPSRGTGDARTAAALSVLSELLGTGITSRFAEAMQRGDKTAIDTGAWYSAASRDATGFAVYAVPAEGVELATVEAGLAAVIARVAAEGPTEAELERIKRRSKASYIYALDSQSSLARLYGRGLAIGLTVEEIEAWPGLIQEVTAEEVKAAAALLRAETSVTGWLMQTKTEEQG